MSRIWTSIFGVLLYVIVILILEDVPLSNAQRYPDYRRDRTKPYRPPQKVHPCDQSSCYPATGNLLIGREKRLEATSTCGVYRPQRYCIVSHLEEKKCFLCDTREGTSDEPLRNHRVGQIIYKTKPGTREQTWWQSENGVENVTIQLDLEAEFHFTHLIIVFQTFRPAAMLIERSYDFGKTFHVYRYFAHNCHESYPLIPTIGRNVTDIICDQRYSGVEPSKDGEIIFRVLPPNMNIANPYADHIQNMLKMTNLRINFTRLHTLGDTLLDDRNEIQEKYYYAIKNMVVRGSCSCYGHASRCLPLEGVDNSIDMVHGRCECTHNTKGLNCEDCEDFYNDLPWQPAFGKKTNACKKCNCNNHATSCHHDHAVFEHTGRISGGVCDNCQHNTQGQHCEECIPFFYRDPLEDIQSPYICKACDCDPRGSLDDGICDSVSDPENEIEAGACHCKNYVKGRRCDQCKDGYWNLDPNNPEGCQNCTCNTLGTINNSGCNMHTGECTCKRLVTGKDCNQCLPETFGLSDSHDGCAFCNCDPGGSLDNHCDIETGQCRCRPHMTGRTCSTPQQHHFIPSLSTVIEAENSECESDASHNNCSLVIPPQDRPPYWTGPGFMRTYEGSQITITVPYVPKTMEYDVVVRYQSQSSNAWEDASIIILKPDDFDADGPCGESEESYGEKIHFRLPDRELSTVAVKNVCFEEGRHYKFKITFRRQSFEEDNPVAQILIDSISLVPRIEVTPIFTGSNAAENRYREYQDSGCNHTYYEVLSEQDIPRECKDLLKFVSIYVHEGAAPCNCDVTGSTSKKCEDYGGLCQCKLNIVGRQCDRCAAGTYGFGPQGCKNCDCNSIGSKNNECDQLTGNCNCHPNTFGRECDQCLPGYWNFPNCQKCECNGHAQTCDSKTGECIGCQEFTTGYSCDRCIDSYYGNPFLGSSIGCRPCRCPDTIVSGHSHADSCDLDTYTNDMVCRCEVGYTGPRCDICADNYFGNPDHPGGVCKPCDCSNNVDPRAPGNCNSRTGQCDNCLHQTDGEHCEYCKDGFWGNAFEQDCQYCHCDVLGTNSTILHCDRYSGQCPCLKNVEGMACNRCIENHWKIASGEGCEACACDSVGSEEDQCNPYDGQCVCRKGFGGRQCNECQTDFWGNPNEECFPCNCDPYGSASYQCDRSTGKCPCKQGIGGHKCDVCDRGYLGEAPYCSPCGECFDNWDIILNELKDSTRRVIDDAKQIKKVGATGAYTKEFDNMELKLQTIQQLLDNTSVSSNDIEYLEGFVIDLRKDLTNSVERLNNSDKVLESIYSGINLASVELDGMRNKSEQIKMDLTNLKENATKLQEANVEGALNLTRQAWDRVTALDALNAESEQINANAERTCKRVEHMFVRSAQSFDDIQNENEKSLKDYNDQLNALSARIPDLNDQMCDRHGDPCDSLCGGAGCGTCGGVSCDKGAYSKADRALENVKAAEKNIKEKEEVAENLVRALSQAKSNASDTYRKAQETLNLIQESFDNSSKIILIGRELITELTDTINNNTGSPAEISEITDKTLALELQLDPDEIQLLAKKIDNTVASLQNVESIIENTKMDLELVEDLKEKANNAKKNADAVLDDAKDVVKALEEAEVAQNKARESIKKANEDITMARIDLEQIDSETDEAKKRADQTATKVDQLQHNLGELQKKFYENDLNAKKITIRAEEVKDAANNAHDVATQLGNQYKSANDSLTAKAKKSEVERQRAQQLLQRASKMTVDTNRSLQSLQEMFDLYKSNSQEVEGLQDRIDDLNSKIAEYLSAIQKSADHYKQCTS